MLQQQQLFFTEEGTAAQPLKPLWKPTENVACLCLYLNFFLWPCWKALLQPSNNQQQMRKQGSMSYSNITIVQSSVI